MLVSLRDFHIGRYDVCTKLLNELVSACARVVPLLRDGGRLTVCWGLPPHGVDADGLLRPLPRGRRWHHRWRWR